MHRLPKMGRRQKTVDLCVFLDSLYSAFKIKHLSGLVFALWLEVVKQKTVWKVLVVQRKSPKGLTAVWCSADFHIERC